MIKRVVILAAFLALSACGPRPVYFRDEKIASTSCDGVKWFLWGVERPPNGFREQVRRCLPVGGSIQVAESLPTAIGLFCDKSNPITPAAGPFGRVVVCSYNGA